MIQSVFDWLETISTSPWFYMAILGVAFLDSVIPVVPSETTVILGGTAAGTGNLSLFLVVLVAIVGAMAGDSVAYFLGQRAAGIVRRILFRGEKGAARLEKVATQIQRRGGVLLITARFIPGGRTALTFTCGTTHQPYLSWFLRWDVVAVIIWASYAAGLGYVFGQRFNHTTAFLLAFGAALGMTAAVELVQAVRRRRSGSGAEYAN